MNHVTVHPIVLYFQTDDLPQKSTKKKTRAIILHRKDINFTVSVNHSTIDFSESIEWSI